MAPLAVGVLAFGASAVVGCILLVYFTFNEW